MRSAEDWVRETADGRPEDFAPEEIADAIDWVRRVQRDAAPGWILRSEREPATPAEYQVFNGTRVFTADWVAFPAPGDPTAERWRFWAALATTDAEDRQITHWAPLLPLPPDAPPPPRRHAGFDVPPRAL